MEEKIDKLRNCIKNNPNLTDVFKVNLGTLTDTLVTVFPEYDYSDFERVLSTLKVSSESLDTYSSIDKESNIIKIDTEKVFEDRIDMQHLFLNDLLELGSKINTNEGFKRGITEAISSTMNNDESMKKLNPMEYTLISIFSKIIDPKVIIDSYMNAGLTDIIFALETVGITKEEFDSLVGKFDTLKQDSNSFADIEVQMIDMYGKSMKHNLDTGSITFDDLNDRYDIFRDMLITKRSELESMYPYHDFSLLKGFEKVNDKLDKAIINSEVEISSMTK